ncbi:hypothetical protein [Lacticaseibacillus kribbianus]|uniref:hypothetical protein n=1 Tax=Lacticaseibacillus kribbianus TaxID=2926292 RepID=UPI001CD7DC23|nr:hypothetical protein [Lacticaseibacillus kribbianus]
MQELTTATPVVWLDDTKFISLIPDAAYNLEVWEITKEDRRHRMARMDYKFHRDTFAGFIYRLIPTIDLVKIHDLQKRINPYFDLEV